MGAAHTREWACADKHVAVSSPALVCVEVRFKGVGPERGGDGNAVVTWQRYQRRRRRQRQRQAHGQAMEHSSSDPKLLAFILHGIQLNGIHLPWLGAKAQRLMGGCSMSQGAPLTMGSWQTLLAPGGGAAA